MYTEYNTYKLVSMALYSLMLCIIATGFAWQIERHRIFETPRYMTDISRASKYENPLSNCENIWDCESPMDCCDFIALKMCCNGKLGIPIPGTEPPELIPIPIPIPDHRNT